MGMKGWAPPFQRENRAAHKDLEKIPSNYQRLKQKMLEFLFHQVLMAYNLVKGEMIHLKPIFTYYEKVDSEFNKSAHAVRNGIGHDGL